MLYDDIQQMEVRYVISLEYHDVDVYAGGEEVPEGELWIKRHSIRLRRKNTQIGDKSSSLPFFLFSQSSSEKEDFYHAILKNQEKSIEEDPPVPQQFDVDHIVLLVQKLHSSEEQLQTRWLNAMIGRVFLAMYKAPEMEDFIRTKLMKKISRVKKPTYITKLALRRIDLGTSPPFFTNPRLKDLTVNGDCTMEVDVNYTGGFRIEIAATARIDLGTRFKAREVDMVLAATCKKLEGHVLVRCKPPPSNRFWFAFEKMPTLELALEPIVSSRQITYTFILRAIESRIREVVAESIVMPFWDDIPFFDTRHQRYRGGIWKKEPQSATSIEIPDEDPEDATEPMDSGAQTPTEITRDDRVMSMPVLGDSKMPGKNGAAKKSVASLNDFLGMKSSESAEKSESSTPRLMRSPSIASAAYPSISTNHAGANTPPRESDSSLKRESVATILKDLSARSGAENHYSPTDSPAGTPSADSAMALGMKWRSSSNGSRMSDQGQGEDVSESRESSLSRDLAASSQASIRSIEDTDPKDVRARSTQEDTKPVRGFSLGARSLTAADRKQALASVNAAAAAAQKWGWGVLARNRQREAQAGAGRGADNASAGTAAPPREPMGRGRPLPPPGTPLPPPERPIKPNSFLAPRRKPVPPPMLPKRPETNGSNESVSAKSSPKPPLPDRRKRHSSVQAENDSENEVFVVEAPTESAPASPAPVDEHHDEFFGHGEPPTEPSPPIEEATQPEAPDELSLHDTPKPLLPERLPIVDEPSLLENEEEGPYNSSQVPDEPAFTKASQPTNKPPKPPLPARDSETLFQVPRDKEEEMM